MDVAGFGDVRRTTPNQVAVRAALYQAMEQAMTAAGMSWTACHHEDRGDGILVLVPAETPKNPLVELLPGALVAALGDHNRSCSQHERVQLRLSLHAGEVVYDKHGVVGPAVNHAFRILEAGALKTALAGSAGVLAMIVSAWFYDNVVWHCPGAVPDSYRKVQVSVKETTTTGWVRLPDRSSPRSSGTTRKALGTVPRQLPAAPAGFSGRLDALQELGTMLDVTDGVAIAVIDGTAGVGKTALALRWAHRISDRFPDGQLYVDLRGFGPGSAPATPAEVLRDFLVGLGTAPELIPVGLDASAALYRSVLADRSVLVLLDNARDAEQVRPLLPGTAGSLVLVTSRSQLTGLITQEGARPLTLDLFTLNEARQLLGHRLGTARVATDPDAVDSVIAACAGLPLALSIAAARAVTKPSFPLSVLDGELRAAQRRLDAFDSGDSDTNARSVFSWSYRGLSVDAAALFRLAGLAPGADVTLPVAACMLDVPRDQARRALAELTRAHLLKEHLPGRYLAHDLLRAYAVELACETDSDSTRSGAIRRALDYYLCSAHAAAQQLYCRFDQITPTMTSNCAETFTEYATAWSWFKAEYPTLVAAVRQAAQAGHSTHAWQTAWVMTEYMDREGFWHEAITVQDVALRAAQRADDPVGAAHAHRGLGHAYLRLREHPRAAERLHIALDLLDTLGDKTGLAHTHIDVAWMQGQLDDPERARVHAERALACARSSEDRLATARSLNAVALFAIRLGDHRTGLDHGRASLAGYRALGDSRGIAYALHMVGLAEHHLGDHHEAINHLEQAIVIKNGLRDHYRKAMALDDLGSTHHAVGDHDAARIAWQRALGILIHLGLDHSDHRTRPNTTDLRHKLAAAGS